MSDLLKKNTPYDWKDEHQKSFDSLKEALCTAPVLQHPDFSQPFILTTDASDFAVGAVLSQGKIGEDRPIAFMSKMMKPDEKITALLKRSALLLYLQYYISDHIYMDENSP